MPFGVAVSLRLPLRAYLRIPEGGTFLTGLQPERLGEQLSQMNQGEQDGLDLLRRGR